MHEIKRYTFHELSHDRQSCGEGKDAKWGKFSNKWTVIVTNFPINGDEYLQL